jgi:thymidylate synthase ThyX
LIRRKNNLNITVLAVTSENYIKENHSIDCSDFVDDLEVFSGKAAGVCYMKDTYFNSSIVDPEKARTRYDKVIGSGHHSVADNVTISVLFENIPKMTAMILNSVGFYNTSEKSGRYTVMSSKEQANTDNERLYYKWYDKFKYLIKQYDPELCEKDERLHDKLALENARYMLSVFAPNTTMVYTTTLRMWSYIVCWCKDYIETADGSTQFNKLVKQCVNDLYLNLLAKSFYSDKIVDNKNKKFYFLANQVDYFIEDADEHIGDCYLIKYKASFADLAQEQRHRTLRYFMCYDGTSQNFYVPELIKDNEDLKNEWLADLNSIACTFPIATMVDVVETGFIHDFMIKCDERLCGRTMLETFNTVKTNLIKFARSWNKSPFMLEMLARHFRDGKIVMKCGNIHCKEPCYWGPIKSQDKKI